MKTEIFLSKNEKMLNHRRRTDRCKFSYSGKPVQVIEKRSKARHSETNERNEIKNVKNEKYFPR